MRATRLLHLAAGLPDPRKPLYPAGGPCYWCGEPVGEVACRVRDACGASFTDHDAAVSPESPWICGGCTWAMTGRPPDTLRGWTLVYREDAGFLRNAEADASVLGPQLRLLRSGGGDVRDVLLHPPDRADRALIEQGLSEDEVAARLCIDVDTVHRYKQVTGIAELFKNATYSQAWEIVTDDE